jgi:hypothetical protein
MFPEPKSGRFKIPRILLIASVVVVLGCSPKNSSNGSASGKSSSKQEVKGKNTGEQKTSALDNPIAGNRAIQGSHDRLALLESFSSLDRLVVDRCFASTVLSSKKFMSENKIKLAQKFTSEIKTYRSLGKLETFGRFVDQLSKTPADSLLDAQLEKLREFQGGDLVLANSRNSDLLEAFGHVISQHLTKLRAHKQIEQLKSFFDDHWHQQFKQQGIGVSVPKDLPSRKSAETQQRVLRHWELSSTRFLLGISGNTVSSKHIQGVYPGKIRPIYLQALNAVLDPTERRFRTIATYQFQMSTGANPVATFKEAPDGQIALVEFTGAIPRAKLFSDWKQGVSADRADEILYSPGFNPHAQILVRQDGLPKPERPAATINLPAVKIESIRTGRVVLQVPALEHNTLLLLNDRYDPDWTATIEGRGTEILRANNNARAVYLKPSDNVRTIDFTNRQSKR